MGKLSSDALAAIQLDNLTKNFGVYRAVSDLSLEVNSGEIFGFLGLNGAGKSTTIKMMLSLLTPSSGSVYMLGNKVNSGSHKLWEQVGYLEDATYYPGLTVIENLDIARRMQMISDRQSIARVIQKLGLEAHKNKKAKNLSLGNKQRLGLAKAMIHNPKILILDEPINGLDPAGVVEIREMLVDLSKNFGVTVFISSHQLEELSKLVDRIGIIHEGRLIQEIKMTHLEQSLQKHMILDGRNKSAMKHILREHGYNFEENIDGRLLLFDGSVTEKPERLAELLVRFGQPPTQLNIVTEDLEGYFLRIIQSKRRIH
ncbi:ABC transporter ATP-binding protein [Clostridium intestinale]|uniref:ABC transporter-like protein n=2 Tax=Clostridium intestinale TaxID=36845 RepID=U2NJL9_9CLOT|nr:ABC transporter ATP-binding protein [Clostridium intestinale]ERK29031.1 ABC transporter-like protein [Clostridium intestinale URNW]QLY80535.1 ABC transporter ATP-binding protein [Clostridium intestinale]